MRKHNKNKDFIKINSANQFEVSVGYLTGSKEKKKIDYTIGIYMFIPKNLDINETTYQKSDFYADYLSYIRLITPKNNLGTISRKISGLVSNMKEHIEDLKTMDELSSRLKVLLCSYLTYLRNFVETVKDTGNIRPKRIRLLLERIHGLQHSKEEILSIKSYSQDEKLLFLLNASAEYLSRTTQHYLFELNIYLSSFGDTHVALINDIVKQINRELQFCKREGYPIISNDEYSNEKVIFRHSFLKKFFYDVLFLYQNRKEDGRGIKELYYAIAAGISMVLTTIVVFATQKEYGNFTLSFFTALVISYMFKDRIKEAYRHYFDKKLRLRTFDYKERIYDPGKKTIFASTKERFRFVDKHMLEDDIIEARLRGTTDRLSSWYTGEDILRYGKLISLHNKNLQQHYNNRVDGIYNIMRFDISKFLRKMDSKKVPLHRIKEGRLYGDKVYHLNLVVSFESKEEKILHKIRIILTKKGIKRIEIPELDLKILRHDQTQEEAGWFPVKKSGLIKHYKIPQQDK